MPKNAQGYAASMIAKGADPATLFAALVEEPPTVAPLGDTEPTVSDLAESEPVASAPVESDPAEEPASPDSAPRAETVSPPETSDAPEVGIVDPAIDLADAALTDDEVALELLTDILDQASE